MKKVLAIAFVFGMVALTSCGGKKAEETTTDTTAVAAPDTMSMDTTAVDSAAVDTATVK